MPKQTEIKRLVRLGMEAEHGDLKRADEKIQR